MGRILVHQRGKGPTSHAIGDGLLIGRGDHCDLVLDDETVSIDHAELSRRGASYLLNDLSSRNGTFLNGRPLERPTRLSPGDVAQIGSFRLEFELPKGIATKPRPGVGIALTEEERSVARALVADYRHGGTFAGRPATRREIAERLHLSESTVRRRLDTIAQKLGLAHEPRGERTRKIADRVIALGLDRP